MLLNPLSLQTCGLSRNRQRSISVCLNESQNIFVGWIEKLINKPFRTLFSVIFFDAPKLSFWSRLMSHIKNLEIRCLGFEVEASWQGLKSSSS